MEEAKICYEEAVKLDPNNASFKGEKIVFNWLSPEDNNYQ